MEFEQNGRTYGKTMEFSFWWKKVRAFFKIFFWENMSGLRNVVSIFVASVITSLGLALRTSRAHNPKLHWTSVASSLSVVSHT